MRQSNFARSIQATRVEVTRVQKVHTIVPHLSPDTEALIMAWMIIGHAVVRKALNCVDSVRLKFVPAGPLRKRDWDEERTVCPKELEEKRGYLFVDCGGGRLDQHVLPDAVAGNKTASLHLLLDELTARAESMYSDADRQELLQLLKIMEGVFLVICKNDLTGEDVAPRTLDAKPETERSPQSGDDLVADMAQELAMPVPGSDYVRVRVPLGASTVLKAANTDPTPHTARHLRNMVLGWNALYPENPEKVFALASVAFGAIEQNVRMLYENPEEMHDLDVRKLFRIEEILMGVEDHFRATLPATTPDVTEGRIMHETKTFTAQAERSLREMERQWYVAMSDYWDSAQGRSVVMQPQVEGKKRRQITVVFGRSESQRFGAVARRGNEEAVRWVTKDDGAKVSPEAELTTSEETGTCLLPKCTPGCDYREFDHHDEYCHGDCSLHASPSDGEKGADSGQVALGSNAETTPRRKSHKARKERVVVGARPCQDQPVRSKADVVIQMYGRGLFVISSVNGIRLDRVAMVLREADLRRQGVEITPTVKAQLSSPGNFVYKNRAGAYIHAIYFTNYRGAVGNFFRANPFCPAASLNETAIRDLVVATLTSDYDVDTSDIVRDYMG